MKEDWIEIPFNEATLNFDGKRKPLSSAFRVNFKGEYPYYGACEIIDYVKEYLFEGDYLLIGEDGANLLSKSKPLAFIATGKFWVNNHAHVVQPKNGLLLNFLAYQFNSLHINEFVTGTAQPKLNQNNLNKIPVGIPPLPIQRAIVSKIEALFSDLDNGIANFKKAQAQLKIYRQAVLKKAFEGKFTNENIAEGKLPKGWKVEKLGEVCDMKAGYFIKASEIKAEYEEGLLPCYGGNGLRGYVKSTTHEGLFPIVGRQGALCGNVHLVNGKFHATEHAVVVSAKNEIDIKCLYYKLIEMKINQYSTGTAQPGLSVNKLLPLEIMMPKTIQEQTQIVQEIERRLSVCDKVEQSIKESIEKAEALRQSILKKAFEGKLLSQAEIAQCKKEADYEPASELLKRIKADASARSAQGKLAKKTSSLKFF